MRITVIMAVVLAALAVAFFASTKADQHITASNATAVPVFGSEGAYIAKVLLTNTGPPDRLITVTSASAADISLDGQHTKKLIVLPGQSSAELAADGVHVRLSRFSDDIGAGSLVPLTLVFEKAGEVVTRLRVSELDTTDHSMHAGMTVEAKAPEPDAQLAVREASASGGIAARLELENFSLVEAAEGTAHVDGEGHAHLYLNGLKLGRLYDTDITIGPLLPGDYDLSVTLNSHFHRVYTRGGLPIGDSYSFSISP
jgi:copper(I)-binding protein